MAVLVSVGRKREGKKPFSSSSALSVYHLQVDAAQEKAKDAAAARSAAASLLESTASADVPRVVGTGGEYGSASQNRPPPGSLDFIRSTVRGASDSNKPSNSGKIDRYIECIFTNYTSSLLSFCVFKKRKTQGTQLPFLSAWQFY